jgi:hypothetical protein
VAIFAMAEMVKLWSDLGRTLLPQMCYIEVTNQPKNSVDNPWPSSYTRQVMTKKKQFDLSPEGKPDD